jgi:hypothetical protein
MLGLFLSGVAIWALRGVPSRPVVALQAENAALLQWNYMETRGCRRKFNLHPNFCLELGDQQNLKLAILGDSSGNSLAPGLSELLGPSVGVLNVGSWSCPPVEGLRLAKVEGLPYSDVWGLEGDCIDIVPKALRYIEESPGVTTVVLALFARDLRFWGVPDMAEDASFEEKFQAFAPLLERTIERMKNAGKKVIVTYDSPYNPVEPVACLARPLGRSFAKRCEAKESELIDRHPFLDLFDAYFRDREDVCVVRQSALLVRDGKSIFFDGNKKLLLRDPHHLTTYGSRRVADLFVEQGCLAAP